MSKKKNHKPNSQYANQNRQTVAEQPKQNMAQNIIEEDVGPTEEEIERFEEPVQKRKVTYEPLKKEKVAVYCGTRNIYSDISLSLKSLLINSDVDTVYLLIEDDEFPEPVPDCVKVINVSGQTIFPKDGPNYENSWTYMVLMRAALTKILPKDIDKVLSLDADTVVDMDVSDLWDIDLEDYYYAGAYETAKTNVATPGHPRSPYINFGVVLINLKQLRKDKKDDEIINTLNTYKYPANEQDCINELCRLRIKEFSSDYNANIWCEMPKQQKIVHFAGNHFLGGTRWDDTLIAKKYKTIPWESIRSEK